MKTTFFLLFRLVMVFSLTLVSDAVAQSFPIPGLTVQEVQEGSQTEYAVFNNAAQVFSFNIVAFAVTSSGDNPSATAQGWTAVTLDAATWLEPMGDNPWDLSWEEYSGLSYTQAFPQDPATVNGYVVSTYGSGDAIGPSESESGFFFQGSPGSDDSFLLINTHDPNIIIEGQVLTSSGTVSVVPEPTVTGLSFLAVTCLIILAHKRHRMG